MRVYENVHYFFLQTVSNYYVQIVASLNLDKTCKIGKHKSFILYGCLTMQTSTPFYRALDDKLMVCKPMDCQAPMGEVLIANLSHSNSNQTGINLNTVNQKGHVTVRKPITKSCFLLHVSIIFFRKYRQNPCLL